MTALNSFTYAQQESTKSIGLEKVNTDVTVKSIGDKYIDAIGGKAAVAKINSVKFTAVGEMQGMPIQVEITQTRDGKSASVVTMNGNPLQKVVWDGKDGYMEMQGTKTPLPEEAKVEFKKVKGIFPEENFADDPNLKLEGTEVINNEQSYKIVGENVIYYYSVKTGLKTGQTMSREVQGQEMTIPTVYTGYTEVEGVKYPSAFSQKMMGMDTTYKVTQHAINKATDADFK